MSHTFRVNPETYEEEVERRHLEHKRKYRDLREDKRRAVKDAAIIMEANDESGD